MRGFGVATLCVALAGIAIVAAPASASNGGRIAFGSGYPEHIWTVKPNGNQLRDLNAGAPADKLYCSPAVSPDGTRIAYVDEYTNPPLAAPNSGFSSLVVANSDGSGARVIPNAFVGGYGCLNEVSWSPDGHHMAYAGGSPTSSTPTQTITVNVDNPLELPRQVSDGQHFYYSAFWSPDGTRIAADGDDGHEHVFSVDGRSPAVTSDRYGCALSGWAPDSARLLEACDGREVQAMGIWSVRAGDLGDPQPVYLGAAYDATYSPDGRTIALRLNGQLATMPADGSAPPTVLVGQDTYGISWGG
jgi:Tol biopolymer transport system component